MKIFILLDPSTRHWSDAAVRLQIAGVWDDAPPFVPVVVDATLPRAGAAPLAMPDGVEIIAIEELCNQQMAFDARKIAMRLARHRSPIVAVDLATIDDGSLATVIDPIGAALRTDRRRPAALVIMHTGHQLARSFDAVLWNFRLGPSRNDEETFLAHVRNESIFMRLTVFLMRTRLTRLLRLVPFSTAIRDRLVRFLTTRPITTH